MEIHGVLTLLFIRSNPNFSPLYCIFVGKSDDNEMNRQNQNIVVVAWSKFAFFTSGKMFFAAKTEHMPSPSHVNFSLSPSMKLTPSTRITQTSTDLRENETYE
jgi:hypothetical protein